MDTAYTHSQAQSRTGELEHRYGDNVHILSDPYHLSLLAALSAEHTTQPRINVLISSLYRHMLAVVVAREFPLKDVTVNTRMIEHTPKGVFRGQITDPSTRTVVVDIARAGIVPAQVCFDALNNVLNPQGVRLDHLIMNRVTDPDGQVTGARIFAEKTGGDVSGQVVLFPDPMGATGSSLSKAISFYKDEAGETPAAVITMSLIVTSEFIQKIVGTHPDVTLYAFRLDRGLSDPDVLQSVPGTYPEREVGLNDQQYIVPGAGGLGEVINNVFV